MQLVGASIGRDLNLSAGEAAIFCVVAIGNDFHGFHSVFPGRDH